MPTRSCPYVGEALIPVPPKAVESVEVAETTPLMAWRLPVMEPMVSPPLKVLRALYVLVVVVEKAVVKTPVLELYARGKMAESEVEEILPANVVKSVEERYPFCDAVPCCIERVLLENKRGAEMMVLCTAPVPFPEMMPESVLEPVPPRETARVPIHVGVKVWVSAADVMMSPRLVSVVVAKV